MNQSLTHFALAALLTVGLMGCATDSPPSSTTEPIRPVFQSQSPVLEGQVVRNEGTAYVIRELSGRQTRVAFDRKTVKDNIAVGDTVVARFDGPPSSACATSITRGTGKPTPPSANASPRFQTVEGIVQQQDGNDSREGTYASNQILRPFGTITFVSGIESSRTRVHRLPSMWIRLLNDDSRSFRIATLWFAAERHPWIMGSGGQE